MATPMWNGTVSFGLLNVPVQLDSGERSVDLHFRLLDSRDRAPIRYERINAVSGEEVAWKDIVKAFEYQLIDAMTTEWRPADYRDDFRERLRSFIEQRIAAERGAEVPKTEAPPAPHATTNVADFMALLKKSLEGKGQRGLRAQRAAAVGERPARSRQHPPVASSESASAGRARPRPAARKSSSHGRRPH